MPKRKRRSRWSATSQKRPIVTPGGTEDDVDLAVGAPGLRVSGSAVGSVWLLDLDGTGRVRRQDRIDAGAGEVEFGRTVACAEDLDGNGTGVDLLVGSETTAGTGQVRVLFLEGSPSSRASHATRNGTGINPSVFVAVNEPVLGQTWRATVDLLRIPCASSSGILFGLAGTLQLPTSLGELLVSPPFLGITIGTENLQVPLPATVWYAGDVIHTQGFAWTCGGLVLLNAIDLHVGY